jgi:23S rRNA (uracil1939-C5)-methyltransferase
MGTLMRGTRRKSRTTASPELLELTIAEIGAHGDGIAHRDGDTVFVPYTLPGDRVRARRIGPAHALPQEWLSRATEPHQPRCSHFGSCGGCALQHLEHDAYAAWKLRQLTVTLARRGFDGVEVAPLVRALPAERRRAAFGAIRTAAQTIAGFHAYRSRTLIDMLDCAVLAPAIVALLPPLRALLHGVLPPSRTVDALVTQTESGLDLLVGHASPPDRRQREAVVAFAEAQDLARIAWRERDETPEVLVQRRVPQVRFADIAVDLPPGAFLQATPSGENAIVAATLSGVAGAKRVADLFAGCGTISLPLSAQARVHAVDGARELADALTAAARRAQRAGRLTVETRDLARRPLLADELDIFDAVVFDPPRDGAAAQAAEIARSKLRKVVGVSCNPATFARDGRILADAGFRLIRVTPIDQFLWSPHLELVGVFER